QQVPFHQGGRPVQQELEKDIVENVPNAKGDNKASEPLVKIMSDCQAGRSQHDKRGCLTTQLDHETLLHFRPRRQLICSQQRKKLALLKVRMKALVQRFVERPQ